MSENESKKETKPVGKKADTEVIEKAVPKQAVKEVIAVPRFSYQSIVNSKQFKRIERDLLRVLLDKNREYTVQEAREILEYEMKRTVE